MNYARMDALVSQVRAHRAAELAAIDEERAAFVGPKQKHIPRPEPTLDLLPSPDLRCMGGCGDKVYGLSRWCRMCEGDDPREANWRRGI